MRGGGKAFQARGQHEGEGWELRLPHKLLGVLGKLLELCEIRMQAK